MALKTVGDVVLRFQKMEQAVSPRMMRPRLTEVGMALKPLATKTAMADLGGDASFSGWPKAGKLEVQFKIHSNGMGLTMHRGGKSAGPWRVAEEGRHPSIGPIKPNITKTGKKAKRQRSHARYSGTTTGFGTWTKASTSMADKARGLFQKAQTKDVIAAFLGK